MLKKYATYRPLWNVKKINEKTNLNGYYHPSFYNDFQFSDYVDAGLTKLEDLSLGIQEDKYIGEVSPGYKSNRRFLVMTYDENIINGDEFANNVKSVGEGFAINLKTVEEARQWIRDNTSLEEVEEGKFLISEAYFDEIEQKEIPERILDLN